MLGIECTWECPECGGLIKTQSAFWTKEYRRKITEPGKCTCGRKGNFILTLFRECNFEVKEGEEI